MKIVIIKGLKVLINEEKKYLNKYSITVLGELVLLLIMSVISLVSNKFTQIPLLTFSAMGLTLLVCLFKYVFYFMFSAEETKNIIIFSLITSIIGLVMYCLIIYTRNYKYLADYTCYYDLQYEYYKLFDNSVIKGFAGTLLSFWKSDYSYFICIFTSLPFYFTTGSHNAFVIVYYLFLLVPMIFSFNMFITSIEKKIQIKKHSLFVIYYVICNILMLTLPLLQYDSLLGMPDIFGLTFLLLLAMIFFNYDIKTINWKYNILLLICSIAVIITRRWYVFSVVGLYVGYAIVSILYNLKSLKIVLVNGIKSFGFISITACIFMLPFIFKTIKSNYSVAYNAWKYGGVLWEVLHQCQFLGFMTVFVLMMGFIVGCMKKELRFHTLISIIAYFVTIFGFTRVQNMMSHHALCLMITYLILIINIFAFASSIKSKVVRYLLVTLVAIILLFNSCLSFSGKIIKCDDFYLSSDINIIVNNGDSNKNAWESE